METLSFDPRPNLQTGKKNIQHRVIVEEIEGLIRVYKDGHIERPQIIPSVPSNFATHNANITARDVMIDKATNLWARVYVPTFVPTRKLPLLVYFHGGGFCVGSASWICYHDFLVNLALKARCVIMSVNYRLAPEYRLPVAYNDGFNALTWIKNQSVHRSSEEAWWLTQCNLSSLFLGGDSAGANIAFNVATRVVGTSDSMIKPMSLKGMILIQPFFGGEARTGSENQLHTQPGSALTLSASDAYWRLSLPLWSNRDHEWCNPLVKGVARLRELKIPSTLVCISEMDILKDRNLEFCASLGSVGKRVEYVMYKGVGHAFQVLRNSQFSQLRIQEMMDDLKVFINKQ